MNLLNLLTEETYVNSKIDSIMKFMNRDLKSVSNREEILKKLKENLDTIFEAEKIRDIEERLFATNTVEEVIEFIEKL